MRAVWWSVGPGLAGSLTYGLFFLRDGWWRALGFNILLALACLPLACLATRGQRLRPLWALSWLLMWPNALYVITDLAHLRNKAPTDLWLDIACYASLTACGVWIGAASLNRVISVIAARAGWPVAGPTALLCCGLCGLGIWLGRTKRYNSWDTLLDPGRILADVAQLVRDPAAHTDAWSFVGIYGSGMAIAAAALWLSSGPGIVGRTPDPAA